MNYRHIAILIRKFVSCYVCCCSLQHNKGLPHSALEKGKQEDNLVYSFNTHLNTPILSGMGGH